jgi:hypothetical protein
MRWNLFTIAACALAAPAIAAPGDWSMRVPAPGFVVGFDRANNQQSIVERVPAGETVERWTRMLTSQRFVGRGQDPGPRGLLLNMQGLMKDACPGGSTTSIIAMTVSGRPGARMRSDCPLNPETGLPETYFIVVFAGSGDLFAEQVAFRRVPSATDVAFAEAYLAKVKLKP